ncbi:hypothetical protein [Streptomyces lydicamycinicus]|uniref:hypothetical protein n=1 Tax=Streptomyces lydicamycinicus TaxID=1546107 RepID=UPI003C2FB7F6
MNSDLKTVDESFFSDENREEAVSAGVALVNAFRRIGVELSDIRLHAPCGDCDITEYAFTLGRIRVEDTKEMAHTINRRMSMLEEIERRWNAEHPKGT